MSYRGSLPGLARLRFARKALILQKDLSIRRAEKDQKDTGNRGRLPEESCDRRGDDRGRFVARVTVCACRDGREGDGFKTVQGGQSQGVAVAGGKESGVGFGIAAADGADGVNDMCGGEISGRGDNSLARRQAPGQSGGAKFTALFEDARTAAAVNGAVNAASAE